MLDFGHDRAYNRDATLRTQSAPLIAIAAWRTGKVEAMRSVIKDMASTEQAWYSAVAATIEEDHTLAQREISNARAGLVAELGQSNAVCWPDIADDARCSGSQRCCHRSCVLGDGPHTVAIGAGRSVSRFIWYHSVRSPSDRDNHTEEGTSAMSTSDL